MVAKTCQSHPHGPGFESITDAILWESWSIVSWFPRVAESRKCVVAACSVCHEALGKHFVKCEGERLQDVGHGKTMDNC